MRMARMSRQLLLLGILGLGAAACGQSMSGSTSTGGTTCPVAGSGGTAAGGNTSGRGGSGGTTSTGGSASGGVTGSAGTTSSGGRQGSGGTVGTGGTALGTGGSSGSGGVLGTGGETTNRTGGTSGGGAGSGGLATGGAGGTTKTGGNSGDASAGGAIGTGGSTGSGGGREPRLRPSSPILPRRLYRGATADEAIHIGQATIYPRRHELQRNRKTLALSFYEVEILRLLHERAGEPVTREEIMGKIWGVSGYGSSRSVDNFVVKLRKKIEEDAANQRHIVTIYGTGYKLLL
jgi:Transcriptional regulatory protein, C terminal